VQNQHTLNEAIIKASKPPFVSKTQASWNAHVFTQHVSHDETV
jgi:hypothetical protein